MVPSPKALVASRRAAATADGSSSGPSTRRMPATATAGRRLEHRRVADAGQLSARRVVRVAVEGVTVSPGTTGTPAATAARRAASLLPSASCVAAAAQ